VRGAGQDRELRVGCHAAVARSDALTPKDLNISMGTCMACHRKSRVSNDCKTCHENLER